MKLTMQEGLFLTSQALSADDVYDCSGQPARRFADQARVAGKMIMLSTPCAQHGHRLRNRSGHCVQCDTSKLSFQSRHRVEGWVYVAYSAAKKLTKVGSSTNIKIREKKLRSDGVANSADWQIVFHAKTIECGQLEQAVHVALVQYLQRTEYLKDGQKQISRECFRCQPIYAVNEVIETAKLLGFSFSDYWHESGFDWE